MQHVEAQNPFFLNRSFPVAHAEGKFVPQNDTVLNSLKVNKQIVFQYKSQGNGKAEYPDNPNGSVNDIAGICDPTGRVLGLMPHPERHLDPMNNPLWTRKGLSNEGDGLMLFKNAVDYFLS